MDLDPGDLLLIHHLCPTFVFLIFKIFYDEHLYGIFLSRRLCSFLYVFPPSLCIYSSCQVSMLCVCFIDEVMEAYCD